MCQTTQYGSSWCVKNRWWVGSDSYTQNVVFNLKANSKTHF